MRKGSGPIEPNTPSLSHGIHHAPTDVGAPTQVLDDLSISPEVSGCPHDQINAPTTFFHFKIFLGGVVVVDAATSVYLHFLFRLNLLGQK